MQSSHFCVKRAITCNIVQFTLRMTRMNTEIDKGIIILQWSFCLLVDLLIFMKMTLFSSGKRVIFLRRIMTGDNFSTQRYDPRSLFCGGHYSSLHRNWWVQLLSQRCMGSISLDRRGGCVILIDCFEFYVVSAIFQPCNGSGCVIMHSTTNNISEEGHILYKRDDCKTKSVQELLQVKINMARRFCQIKGI